MIVPTNDGGTLYKVVVAPFETRADGQAACEQLKTKGLTCMVVTKK
jgi:cell division protein FtsN